MGKYRRFALELADRLVRASAVFGMYQDRSDTPSWLGESVPQNPGPTVGSPASRVGGAHAFTPADPTVPQLLSDLAMCRGTYEIDRVLAMLPSAWQQGLGALPPWQVAYIAQRYGADVADAAEPGFDVAAFGAILEKRYEAPSSEPEALPPAPEPEHPVEMKLGNDRARHAACVLVGDWATLPSELRTDSLRSALSSHPTIVSTFQAFGAARVAEWAVGHVDMDLPDAPDPEVWPAPPERLERGDGPVDWAQVWKALNAALTFFGVAPTPAMHT